jgi:hypothetical protein
MSQGDEMSAFLTDPLAFFQSGWQWFWMLLGATDGRIMLIIGVVTWFALERVMAAIYDPLLKAFAVLLFIFIVIFGGTVWGGKVSVGGRAMNFDTLYRPSP